MNYKPMTEEDKIVLEDFLNQVINNCNDEALLNHYTGAVRTQEKNEIELEYFTVMIDRLFEEVLRRMGQKGNVDIAHGIENGYVPMCPYGLTDCIYDRNYIKHYYPEWYKKLGSPTECEGCIDGSEYDDEDK